MGKFFSFLLTFLFLTFAGPVYAQTTETIVQLKIGDNQALVNNSPVQLAAPATIIDGSTLVPLRFCEAFGCKIYWNNQTQAAILTMEDHFIEVPVGKQAAVVNGLETPLQAPAKLINGRTYVPLRFIGECLGADIQWNDKDQKVTIGMRRYQSDKQKFKMMLPWEWTPDSENKEKVSFRIAETGYCVISDTGVNTINRANFAIFAGTWMENYNIKEKIAAHKDTNCATVVLKKDKLIEVITVKLINNGLYTIVAGYPEGSFTEDLGKKHDLVLNTLSGI